MWFREQWFSPTLHIAKIPGFFPGGGCESIQSESSTEIPAMCYAVVVFLCGDGGYSKRLSAKE